MGIVNVTPDSFSDGGRYLDPGAAVAHALELIEEGADIIDVGGESTRPGAIPVDEADELARVIPVIRALATQTTTPISIDTMKPHVAIAALDAGAEMLNDVSGGQDRDMLRLAAAAGVPICLMHMPGDPRTMQDDPRYDDVTREVAAALLELVEQAVADGVPRQGIFLDPGFGFGKTAAHNVELLARLDEITALGFPVLVGLSRKSFIGMTLGLPVEDRLEASLAAAAIAVMNGARIVRVHDVRATRRVVDMVRAVRDAGR